MINYIVDIAPCGSLFKNMVRGYFVNSNAIDVEAIVEFIYRESTNQIVDIIQVDQNDFMLNLLCLPNFQYFEGIPNFEDYAARQAFIKAFQEHGMNIWIKVFQCIQIQRDKTYSALRVEEHYMVVCEETK